MGEIARLLARTPHGLLEIKLKIKSHHMVARGIDLFLRTRGAATQVLLRTRPRCGFPNSSISYREIIDAGRRPNKKSEQGNYLDSIPSDKALWAFHKSKPKPKSTR
jgi:hypothetical protein